MFLYIFITTVNTIWGEKNTLIKMIKKIKYKLFTTNRILIVILAS